MIAENSRLVVCLILAVFLFAAVIPVSLVALQEESGQEGKPVEKEAAEEVQQAGQEVVEKRQAEKPEAETTDQMDEEGAVETIVPAPKNQKEAIGIYVFLLWLWLSIFVLIYVLLLKVKETDRIHQLKFFDK
jgi:hypothetical protein